MTPHSRGPATGQGPTAAPADSSGDVSRDPSDDAAAPASSAPEPASVPADEPVDAVRGLEASTPPSSGQWFSLERVKMAVMDGGGHRLGVLVQGSRFGVYRVGPCIGEGGMARVYRAEHAGLKRQVALKVLTDGFARNTDGRERFLREARNAAAIKHPNVVNIFDVGVQDDIPYLVMELLEGQDLEQLIGSTGALPETLIVDVMVPVVAGLIAVHDAGIVHRDLKPGNIFLARGRHHDIEPKLLDFGISKAPGPDQLKLTTGRRIMGTPLYVSPEGLHGGEMTPLSDQYSLGVVMYECATGRTPFPASNFAELATMIAAGRHAGANEINPAISKRLTAIIDRAMSLEPERRFRDMRELGRELLLLAGQRTRITWGMSFGEKRTLSSTPTAHGMDSRLDLVAPMPAGRKALALSALLVFGVVQAALLGTGISAWISGRFSLGRAAPATNAPDTSEAATAAALVLSGSTPPTAIATLAPSPTPVQPAPEAAPATTASSAAEVRVPEEEPIANALPRATSTAIAPPAPAPLKADAGPSATSAPPVDRRSAPPVDVSDNPEWAIPANATPPAPSTAPAPSRVGANGAPIFD